MDALLSVPLLSVFFLPAFTSWSTSLNLLFFYLTWSTLLLSHSALKVEFLGTLFIRIIFYLLPSYFFLLFDTVLPSLATNIKEHGEAGIATDRSHGGYGRKGTWWRVMLWSTFNVVLGVAFQTLVNALMTRVLHVRSPLKITRTLPLPWGIIKDIVRAFVLRECLSYLLHRYMTHSKQAPLRRQHRSWFHSLPATYSLTAHYDHPLAYLVRIVVPTYLPAAAVRMHLLTYHMFLALVSLEELFVYSGYSWLPSSIILGRMARRQEAHLMTRGKGNYSPYGVADLLAGTGMGSDVLDDMIDEGAKHDVPNKLQHQAKKATKQAKGKKQKTMQRLRGEVDTDSDAQ